MGNSAPIADIRVQRCAEILKLTKGEIADFYAIFQSRDAHRTNTISANDFFALICEKKTPYGMAIFELIDIDDADKMEFGEFMQAVVTYCLFETTEMLRFIFFIYDREKNGLISQDELRFFISGLHDKEVLDGNIGIAFRSIEFGPDGKVEFDELCKIHQAFPFMLYPCFRLQSSMMINVMGQAWWQKKKSELAFEREADSRYLAAARKRRLKEKRKERKKMIVSQIGQFNYYFNMSKRDKMEQAYPEITMADIIQEEIDEQQDEA